MSINVDDLAITATIKNARILPWKGYSGEVIYVVGGNVYGDKERRFDDGTYITTSAVIDWPDGRNIAITRNSVYRVELKP